MQILLQDEQALSCDVISYGNLNSLGRRPFRQNQSQVKWNFSRTLLSSKESTISSPLSFALSDFSFLLSSRSRMAFEERLSIHSAVGDILHFLLCRTVSVAKFLPPSLARRDMFTARHQNESIQESNLPQRERELQRQRLQRH